MPSGERLVSGDALLTVTKVEGDRVTGWFYTEWWHDEIAAALLRNTECEYGELGEDCECADCLIGDGLTYDRSHGEYHAESVTFEWLWQSVNEGDRLTVTALFALEDMEGVDDVHGWSGMERTVSSRGHHWTEWTVLMARPLAVEVTA